jgi:mannosyl-glycoprotein endo-beta-N-acetylglucosaminidase
MLGESRSHLSALMLVATMLGAATSPLLAGTLPGQPYASYWFPSTILDWDPATDPDAPFNRSGVPIATRFSSPYFNVNPHAHLDEGRVQSLVAFAPTSFNPSQGSPTMDYYALNYWQYMDSLVFWGGSAGEGLILAPNPTVIDAGHRNGVPVLGNVYLPPTAFGGQIQWVRDFVQRNGATFPVADKMIEAAEYYGFDGWFINQETAGGDAQLATDMRDMLEYFHAQSNLKIVWYDSMTQTGAISYQNALDAQNQMFFQDGTTLVSDGMFLNFDWTATGLANSSALATSLGRSPYDLFAGIDVQSHGYNTSVNWAAVFPEGSPHVTSIGFYRPEWTFTSSSSPSDFYTRDNHFWVGPNHDPSNTVTTAAWKGVANYIPANSPINTLPFFTNFNTGQGSLYAIDGVVRATDEWNNLSVQDVLPTFRWIVRTDGTPLAASLDWSDAYWGGTSLLVSGTLDAINDVLLYETDLAVGAQMNLQIVFKSGQATGATHLQAGLAFEDSPSTFEYFDVGDNTSADWTLAQFDLTAYAGRSIAAIALRFVDSGTPETYSMRIGRLAIAVGTPVPEPPSDVQVLSKNETSPSTATLRLAWTGSPSPINSYNVLHRHSDGSFTWLGATPNTAYFVGNLTRDGNEPASTIEVNAVNPEFVQSGPVSISVPWDAIFADGFDTAP